jgi:hypothetical protein
VADGHEFGTDDDLAWVADPVSVPHSVTNQVASYALSAANEGGRVRRILLGSAGDVWRGSPSQCRTFAAVAFPGHAALLPLGVRREARRALDRLAEQIRLG